MDMANLWPALRIITRQMACFRFGASRSAKRIRGFESEKITNFIHTSLFYEEADVPLHGMYE